MIDSACCGVTVMPAFLARERTASSHQMVLCDLATFLTEDAVWPAVIFQPLKASRIVREILLELRESILLHGRYLSLPTMIVS